MLVSLFWGPQTHLSSETYVSPWSVVSRPLRKINPVAQYHVTPTVQLRLPPSARSPCPARLPCKQDGVDRRRSGRRGLAGRLRWRRRRRRRAAHARSGSSLPWPRRPRRASPPGRFQRRRRACADVGGLLVHYCSYLRDAAPYCRGAAPARHRTVAAPRRRPRAMRRCRRATVLVHYCSYCTRTLRGYVLYVYPVFLKILRKHCVSSVSEI